MRAIKQLIGGILLCLVEVVVGVLLLIDPIGFTTGIISACGLMLILWGLVQIFRYFRTEPAAAAEGQGLMKGLILLVLGIFAVLNSEWFLAAFPLMTIAYGVVILVSAFGKIQWAVDMLRAGKRRWFWAAISAAASVICALVILSSPFASTAVLWTFTGVSLICEAVLDIITFFISSGKGNAEEKNDIVEEAE